MNLDRKTSRRAFGHHVQHLRRARGWTQETLAERSDLSPATIRRLERGLFTPNIDTLIRLCAGLNLTMGTFFVALEMPDDSDVTREVADLLRTRLPREQALALKMLHTLFANLDGVRDELSADDPIADDEPTD